jgi:hypothetical protein
LASLGALVRGYGVSWSLRLSEPRKGWLSVPSVGEQAGALTEFRMTGPAAVPPRTRVSVASGRWVTAPAPSPEWHVMLETASHEPPMDLGEPLDAGNGEVRDSITLALDPISIGPVLDADDPRVSEMHPPSGTSRNIGEPLDADGSGASPMAGGDPIHVGPSLDADDPRGWNFDQPARPTTEIGEILDAGTPRNR